MGPGLLRKIIAQELPEDGTLPSLRRLGISIGLKELLRDCALPEIKPRPISDSNICTKEAYTSVLSVLRDKDPDRFNSALLTDYLDTLLFRHKLLDSNVDYYEQEKSKSDISQFFSSLSYEQIFKILKESSTDLLKELNCMAACCFLDVESRAFIFEPFVRSDMPDKSFFDQLVQDPEFRRFFDNLLEYCEEELNSYDNQEDSVRASPTSMQREDNLYLLSERLSFLISPEDRLIAQ